MKKSVLLLLGTVMTGMAWGQAARIVFNNTAGTPYMVWNPDPRPAQNGGAYLVIDNPADNAITYLGANTTGNFRSEAAQNKIRWNIGNYAVGLPNSYVINWGNQANVGFPLTVDFTVAPVGTGSFVFSTYSYFPYLNTSGLGGTVAPANGWDNTLYMADANVTHMNDFTTGLPNNSDQAIDRFWIIDTKEAGWAYVNSPTVELTFDHANADVLGSNAIVGGTTSLAAQRFNTGTNKWGDFIPTSAYAANTSPGVSRVNNVLIGGIDFFRAWTLTNRSQPLPVELTSFKGICENNNVKLIWSTATETNSAFFTVEKSHDLTTWEAVGTVNAAGNSISQQDYALVDELSDGLAYYRLTQTDNNGDVRVHDMISASCDGTNGTEIVTTWDDGTNVNVMVSSTIDVVHDVILMDMQGKTMASKPKQTMVNGMTTISFSKENLSTGIYVFKLQNSTQLLQRKVMVY